MLPFRIVYHEGYDLNLGDHVFPSLKFRLIRERLLGVGFADESDFVAPEPAPDADLLLVHEAGWIERLRTGTLSYREVLRLEIPYSQQMVDAFWLAAGGTTLAARHALSDGVGFNLGGGFHHAFPGHGEGFCAIHDVAVAIRRLQKDGLIERAVVVDCDVHQGNGTAAIFSGDRSVLTLSIHQFKNYPADKPPSTIDIHLADGAGDEEYLKKLRDGCEALIAGFRPQLVLYVAGADPYCEDKLGRLNLTVEGLRERDRMVMGMALRHRAAVAVTLAGGYALNPADTVTIHANTARAAKEVLEEAGWRKTR
ncbi:MAG: histone deacetylase [Acidobacteria bacterium]|jgi:acetoin utilization deacetylase AcuC-like enzyme|nr:histone deacetylase [Acidobacteriota bacterium]